jgi:hypothetical protein
VALGKIAHFVRERILVGENVLLREHILVVEKDILCGTHTHTHTG